MRQEGSYIQVLLMPACLSAAAAATAATAPAGAADAAGAVSTFFINSNLVERSTFVVAELSDPASTIGFT